MNSNFEQSFLVTQFWHKYLREGRNNIRLMLRGREIEFHATSKVDVYKGTIRGLLPALSKKESRIKILIDTHEYGILEVDNDYPIIVRDIDLDEGVRWYSKGKLGPDERIDIEPIFKVRDRVRKTGRSYYMDGDEWKSTDNVENNKVIVEIKDVENYHGYTGQLLKIGDYWPWFQTTNFEIFNQSHIKETRETPKEILDIFGDRMQSIKLENNMELKVERTKGSYKIIIVDDNKTVARLYIQSIKNKGGKFYAEVRRVHVNDEYRNKGLGSKLMDYVVKVFGDFNLYLYPSPNRIKDLNDDNREIYRNKLRKFYGKYGFKDIEGKNRMERYVEGIRWYNKGKLGPEEEIIEKENIFKVGDYIVKSEGDIYKWSSDEINLDTAKYGRWELSDAFDRLETVRVAVVNYVNDLKGYTGQIIKIHGKWPWYQSTNFMLVPKNEEVRWYSKGKLGPEEEREVVETSFKIGDRLFMPGGAKGAYWNDGTDSAARTSLKNPGKWVPYRADSVWTVDRIDFVRDLDGYTGSMLHFDSVWPWFQETGFEVSHDKI